MANYNPDKHCGGQRPNQPPGTLCTRPKGWGTKHPGIGRCARHCGATPNHNRAAERVIAEREIVRLGIQPSEAPRKLDPRDVLSEQLWRTRAYVLVLDHLVGELKLDEGGIYGPTYHASGFLTGEGKPHVLVAMHAEAERRLTDVAVAASRAGIEAWQIERDKRAGAALAELIRDVIDALGLTAPKRQEAMRVAANRLRLLPGGTA